MHNSIKELKAEGRLVEVSKLIPYAEFLGLDCLEDSGLGLIAVLRQNETNIGNFIARNIHGGVIGALLEHAAIVTLWENYDMDSVPKTINISIDYLRPAKEGETFAKAELIRQGRRIANLRIQAWQGDPTKPVAAAHAHFLLA